ncbi:hypothetical protein ACIBVL_05715 [Streptomyces sp. NPDC049687]|uniref:hypothetical protein n=1 Tax=Streptomyces sp. NPDC049687 TaxID=3365596 RepID=UPI003793C9EB
MNHRTTAAALASCVLAAAVLTACGSGEPAAGHKEPAVSGKTPAASTTPAGTDTEDRADSPSAAPHPASGTSAHPSGTGRQTKKGEAVLPPRPDANGEAAYVRALTAIDPDIVHDQEDKAVERGRAQCATIQDNPDDREKQISTAMRRFTSPGHPDGFGRVESTRIVDAVHTHLCPDY